MPKLQALAYLNLIFTAFLLDGLKLQKLYSLNLITNQ